MAVAQLAASLALYGDTQRAEATFGAALRLASATADYDHSRSDYGSRLRDGAAMLALAAESRPTPAVVPELIRMVSAERAQAMHLSTQDDAWMLLAARALRGGNEAITLDVNGAEHSGTLSERVSGADLLVNPIVIANRGPDPVQAVITKGLARLSCRIEHERPIV